MAVWLLGGDQERSLTADQFVFQDGRTYRTQEKGLLKSLKVREAIIAFERPRPITASFAGVVRLSGHRKGLARSVSPASSFGTRSAPCPGPFCRCSLTGCRIEVSKAYACSSGTRSASKAPRCPSCTIPGIVGSKT